MAGRGIAAVVLVLLALANSARAQDAACDTPLTANALNASVTLNNVYWQPEGGDVSFKIDGLGDAAQVGATLIVCFRYAPDGRWTESPSVRRLPSTGTILIGASVPDEILDSDHAHRHVATLGFAADGEIRVIAQNGDKKPIYWNTQPIGISCISLSAIAAIVAVLLTWIFLARVRKMRNLPRGPNWILSVISDGNGNASLSQFQIILWTFVIGASAVYVMVLSGSLLSISDGTLILLGISGVAAAGAKLNAMMATNPNPPPPTLTQAQPAPKPSPGVPHWSDLVISTTDDNEIDVTRVQMLFFTVVAAVFVLLKVLSTWVVPDIPTNFLLLMGISNGVYLTSKFIRR